MIAFPQLVRCSLPSVTLLAFALLAMPAIQADAASTLERADAKLRYENCLSLANLNPNAALGVATEWSKAKGGEIGRAHV